jgi:hypothetical protein
MKCPRCAAACAPGSVACTYCNAPLASADALGDAARALDARFDALGAAVSTGIASLTAARAVAVPGPAGADPVARLRDALDAQARALPPPGTAQEALVWLRRAPTMAWVSYRAHGLVRSFALGNLPEVLADLYRDRAQWEARDPGLKAVFAQQAEAAHDASPTVSQGARRFARGNPLVSVAALVAALWAVWTSLRPTRRPARRPTRRRSRAA